MGNSRNVTDTNSRLLENLNGISEKVYASKNVELQISNAVTESMITTARLVKYYPSLNKCKVQLDNNEKYVYCTVNLLMGGDVMFLYTPLGDSTYCDDMHEPCVIPRGLVRVFVAPINNQKEWIMLGYYFPNELVGFNPSKKGNFKILAFGSLGEYSVRFGVDGLQIVTNGQIKKEEVNDWGEDVSTKYYTSEDIDNILKEYTDRMDEYETTVSDYENKINTYENRIKVLEEKLGITQEETTGETGTPTTPTNTDTNPTTPPSTNENNNTPPVDEEDEDGDD